MAYTELPLAIIAVGKAIKREIFTTIRSDLIDHETRITDLSLNTAPIEIWNNTVLNASSASTMTGLDYYRAITSFTISRVEIEIFQKGLVTSGVLSIDVEKGNTMDAGSMTSVLSVQPSIDFATASDYAISTGTLNVSNQTVTAGQFLRLDVTSLPAISLGKFRVLVYGTI
jgi:hypothetical protein